MTNPPDGRRAPAWRWVAHEPDRVPGRGGAPTQEAPVPRSRTGSAWRDTTPAYSHQPRWGLPWPVVRPLDEAPVRSASAGSGNADESSTGSGLDRGVSAFLSRQAEPILQMLQWIVIVAAVAHGIRYVVLAIFARSITPAWVEVLSTAVVWASGIFAFGAGVATVVCAVGWLIHTRAVSLAPLRDERRRAPQWLMCLIPPLNLVYPVLLLRELEALVRWRRSSSPGANRAESLADLPRTPDPQTRKWVNRWWLLWVLNWLMLGAVIWRGSADGPQAAADTVLLTSLNLVIAAGVAWTTRRVIQCFDDPSRGFTRRYFVARILD